MLKPRNYDTTRGFSDFKPLPPGGYVCRIMGVKETQSKTSGKNMIEISLDIFEGEQANYYRNLYNSTPYSGDGSRKWGCVVRQVIDETNEFSIRGLKTFHTSVEESNSGFKVLWGEGYADNFKGRLVGCLFRREQYVNNNTGKTGWSTKPFMFRSIETIREGKFDMPKDKPLNNGGGYGGYASNADIGYSASEQIDPDDLPF